jgi:hypothetical protein
MSDSNRHSAFDGSAWQGATADKATSIAPMATVHVNLIIFHFLQLGYSLPLQSLLQGVELSIVIEAEPLATLSQWSKCPAVTGSPVR